MKPTALITAADKATAAANRCFGILNRANQGRDKDLATMRKRCDEISAAIDAAQSVVEAKAAKACETRSHGDRMAYLKLSVAQRERRQELAELEETMGLYRTGGAGLEETPPKKTERK